MKMPNNFNRPDIYHFLIFVYENNVIDYATEFRAYWAPKGPSYGLSRCMPWGALSLLKYEHIFGEKIIDTVYESVHLVKDALDNRYVHIGEIYYRFSFDFNEFNEEYDMLIFNALLVVISNGALTYKGGNQ